MEFNPEQAILKLFTKDKKYLDKYESICNNILKEKHILLIYHSIIQYYNNISTHSYISKDELIGYIKLHYSTYKDIQTIIDVIEAIYSMDISDSLSKDIITKLIEKDISNKIINKLLPVISENKFSILPTIEDELEEYRKYINHEEQKESPFLQADLKDIIKELVVQEGGLKWRLQCLQDSLGSLQGGILGHVFARPNTGKTSFLADQITGFARQLGQDECVIWYNNEERGKKVQLRLYNAMLDASDDHIQRNVDRAIEEFEKRNGRAIHILDSGIIQFTDIVEHIKEFNPRLIIEAVEH